VGRAGFRIGVDLDNTLADFDTLFREAAIAGGLLPAAFAGGKTEVRAAVRAGPGGETAWRHLQGRVYGPLMEGAPLFAGAAEFLVACRVRGDRVFIVSHKTRLGHGGTADLHAAAFSWLAAKGFFAPRGFGIGLADVFLAPDRAAKLARIAALDLSHFIDDLPEVLDDPAFPEGPRRLLFAPLGGASARAGAVCRSWPEIQTAIFGR
jgi:hypothetical protein